jgi:hypothetical protein
MRVIECASLVWIAGCVALPDTSSNASIRLSAFWDATGCGPPHRVAFALEDDDGDALSRAAPCDAGTLDFDVPRLGTYRGTVSAWTLAGGSGATDDVSIDVVASETRWDLPQVP